jgi:hypothetical protein
MELTRENLEAVVREWQRRLNIPHWRVVINWEKHLDPAETFAEIRRDGEAQYEGAELLVASNWATWKLVDANEIIVHELMHMLASDLDVAVASAADVMTGPAYKVFSARTLHESEGLIDKVALLLVKFAGPFDPTKEEPYVQAA